MIFLVLAAIVLIGGLAFSYSATRHLFDDVRAPLVEPAPDAFPLRYRSPYVAPRHVIGMEGVINGRPWRRDNEGNPIFGYQPRPDPNRSVPPQGGSVLSPYSLQATADRALTNMRAIEDAKPTVQEMAEALATMATARPSVHDLMRPVARYYPATDTLELAPYPQQDAAEPMAIECEVRYE